MAKEYDVVALGELLVDMAEVAFIGKVGDAYDKVEAAWCHANVYFGTIFLISE